MGVKYKNQMEDEEDKKMSEQMEEVPEHTHEEIEMLAQQLAAMENEFMELKSAMAQASPNMEQIVDSETSFVDDSGRTTIDAQGADEDPDVVKDIEQKKERKRRERKRREQADEDEDEEDKKAELMDEDDEDAKKEAAGEIDPAETAEADLDAENIPEADRAEIAEALRALRRERKRKEKLSGRMSRVSSGRSNRGASFAAVERLVKEGAKKL